jgi:hypothetical protein
VKIAVCNPFFLLEPASQNYNGYNLAFVKATRPLLYVSDPRFVPAIAEGLRRQRLLALLPNITVSVKRLNRCADVLVDFTGRPDRRTVPEQFNGMKAVHVMDYVFRARESHQALRTAKVDYVLGYADHGRWCSFFQAMYPTYINRVITVPFGFSPRFQATTPFDDREAKVLAAGAVNPIDDPLANFGELDDYIAFYFGHTWTHEWRRTLVEHETHLLPIMTSLLPHFPTTKNNNYDAPAQLNHFMMFANDEGLMAFPPARTYEGAAAGAVLVANDHPCYAAMGFENGENCLLHRHLDIDDFQKVVKDGLADQEQLAIIAHSGTKLVTEHYTHELIAQQLIRDLQQRL